MRHPYLRRGTTRYVALALALQLAAPWTAPAARAGEADPPPPAVEIRATGPGDGAAPEPARSDTRRPANPLWAIAIETLSATRDRPLFSPSRRPSAAPEAPPPPPAPVAVAAPAQPRFSLVGTVVGTADRYGIFLDPASGSVVRLRPGEAHEGWVLRSVGMRDVLLQNGRASAVLALPAREGSAGAIATRGPDGRSRADLPPTARPAAGSIVAPRRPQPAPADLDSSH